VDAQRLEMGMTALQPKEETNNGKTTEAKVAPETKMDIAAEPIAKPKTKAEEKAELAKETAAVFKDLKEKHPDALLLMRKGDFYEAFEDDAKKVAKSTGLKEQHIIKDGLSNKENKEGEKGVSYVNFKNTSLDKYLPKLVRDGHRVAIVDNLEDMAKQRISERKEQLEQHVAAKAQQSASAKTIPLDQFNKLETEDGKKIDHFAVFKMKSGNYGVRAMVDGQQMSVKALDKEDRNAFFEHTTTKAALVQKYYGKELSQPKHEERSRARAM
jgi:DNA mismatch repair ATPase MutS